MDKIVFDNGKVWVVVYHHDSARQVSIVGPRGSVQLTPEELADIATAVEWRLDEED